MSLSRRAFLAAGGSAALAAPALATSPLMPETRPTIKPNRLRPGDTVGIVSPAGVTYHRVQIEILQEVIALTVFVPFAVFYLREKLTLDYLWAGLCLLGAVFFLFRAKLMGGA